MSQKKLWKGSSFISGEPPNGMGLRFYEEGDEGVIATVILNKRHEGPPGYCHGGFSAAMLDEAMGGAVWCKRYKVVAVHIEFDLRFAVPLGEELIVRGWMVKTEGRKVYTAGSITLPNGKVAVEGQGIFVEAAHLFGDKTYDFVDSTIAEGSGKLDS